MDGLICFSATSTYCMTRPSSVLLLLYPNEHRQAKQMNKFFLITVLKMFFQIKPKISLRKINGLWGV